MMGESVAEEESWEKPFRDAIDAVRKGDFEEIRTALEFLGFRFVQTKDPNHWIYYHPLLKADPYFRYPRNLYRPHGSRRSSDHFSKHDQSQARQVIEALSAVVGSSQENGGDKK